MAKRTMNVVNLILKHGEKIPKIQKLLGQKEKLEDQIKTAQRRLKTVGTQLDRLVSAAEGAPRKRRKKKAKRGRPKGKGKVGRPKGKAGRPRGRKKKAGRSAKPTEGKTPYLMAQVMSRAKAMKPAAIVAALRKAGKRVNLGTVKHGLSHYPFFKNVRGKGFTYAGPAVPVLKKAKKKKAGKKAAKKVVKKKTAKKKATRKKTAKKAAQAAAPSPAPTATEGQSG
jgi:hypothetical protein